jgi:hypothetical protein
LQKADGISSAPTLRPLHFLESKLDNDQRSTRRPCRLARAARARAAAVREARLGVGAVRIQGGHERRLLRQQRKALGVGRQHCLQRARRVARHLRGRTAKVLVAR